MGGFFEELAKKLAERWVGLLLVPGALFAAAVWIGAELGQAHALDRTAFDQVATEAFTALVHQPQIGQVVLLAAALLVASGTGLSVQALAGVTRSIWLGQWPWPLRWLRHQRVTHRRARWHRYVQRRHELQSVHPRETRTPEQQREINAAAEAVNRLAMAEPGRPTWMGDRVHAVERIALDRYGLDLPFAWSRLWLVLPEITRTEITTAHARFAATVATGTWAWPYLLLGVRWWPAALIGTVIGITGWARARGAVADLTSLSESALDLHGRTLATELGVVDENSTGPLTVAEGKSLTALIRKGR